MKTLLSFLVLISLTTAIVAAPPAPPDAGPTPGPDPVAVGRPAPPAPRSDPLAEHLFPPEFLLHHARTAGLSKEQLQAIKADFLQAQGRFAELQWDLAAEQQALSELLQRERVDEPAALAHLEKILRLESEIKKAQLALAIRIKNRLTVEQQQKLRMLRRPPHPAAVGEPPHPGGHRPPLPLQPPAPPAD